MAGGGGRPRIKTNKKLDKFDIFLTVTLTPFTICQMNSTHESNSPVTFPVDSCSIQTPTQRQVHVNDRSILFVGENWLEMLFHG